MANEKSVLSEYKDFYARIQVHADEEYEENRFSFEESILKWLQKIAELQDEVVRLQDELVKTKKDNTILQSNLANARQMLHAEKRQRSNIEKQKTEMDGQIAMIVGMLKKGNINESREKLQGLSNSLGYQEQGRDVNFKDLLSPNFLSTIEEDCDTLGSVLGVSDLDLSGVDDIDLSTTRSGRLYRHSQSLNKSGRKRKSSSGKSNCSRSKHSKSNSDENKENVDSQSGDKQWNKDGREMVKKLPSAPPMSDNDNDEIIGKSLTSFPSNVQFTPQRHHQQMAPRPSVQVFTPMSGTLYCSPGSSPMKRNGSASKMNQRRHSFVSKTIYWTEFCQPCEKKIKFGKVAYKCRDCKVTCHMECKDKVPLPCIATHNTPGAKNSACYTVADYAPRSPPMVPAIVVHCTNEVESRGLNEVGIYRVPGAEREVKDLKERFLKGKGVPNMSNIDIHVVCGTLKLFLRSLKEPLIPNSLWRDFVSSADKEPQDAHAVLYQAISDLPQPNRDTLAWVVCHLQRVAECVECKMPTSNLAKVFGVNILGYSLPQLEPVDLIMETKLQQKVTELLMDISNDYWRNFLDYDESPTVENGGCTPEVVTTTMNRRRSIMKIGPMPDRY